MSKKNRMRDLEPRPSFMPAPPEPAPAVRDELAPGEEWQRSPSGAHVRCGGCGRTYTGGVGGCPNGCNRVSAGGDAITTVSVPLAAVATSEPWR